MILNNSSVVDQSASINRIPYKPRLMGALSLYRERMVGSDAVSFDVRENSLHVLEDHLRNVSDKNAMDERSFDMHTLPLVHYPITNTIGRERLSGVRGFGQDSEQAVAAAVAEELERQSERHDVTMEHMVAQMTINGQLATQHFGTIDAATEFGVSRPSQVLTEGSIVTDLRAAQRASKGNLGNGGFVNGYILLAGVTLFDDIINSGDIATAYQFAQAQTNPLLNQLGEVANGYSVFQYGNTMIVCYDDTFTLHDGTTDQPLGDTEGVLIPRTQLGTVFHGPESTLGGLGNGGARRFARSYRDERDRFIEVSSEQNTLAIAEEYGAIVDISYSAGA